MRKDKKNLILLAGVAVVSLGIGWWLGAKRTVTIESVKTPVPVVTQPVKPAVRVPLVDPHAPKIAIVLDDWGYNLNNLPILNGIDIPMTLAILPHLRFSAKLPANLAGRNYEFILHMPMEAHNDKIRPEERTLYTNMQESEIQQTLDEALSSIPNLKGISNHMGSKATEDARLLTVVMEELQRKELYFLDSLVTPHSVAEQVSRQIGVPFAQRDVFLDNELREEYIEAQIRKTIQQAKEYGSAIGIGHDRAITLKVIQRMIPEMKAEGIQFVYVSQLVKDWKFTGSKHAHSGN